ncbi:MAG: hypothetical protein NT099_02650, partial [Candidatus Saganbacteria bacterium]|nr:hypothetical protein [Candidatus Saganbacteria bacterium]
IERGFIKKSFKAFDKQAFKIHFSSLIISQIPSSSKDLGAIKFNSQSKSVLKNRLFGDEYIKFTLNMQGKNKVPPRNLKTGFS